VLFFNGMDVKRKNSFFLAGENQQPGLFPQLEAIKHWPVKFKAEFGLDTLPEEPGLILIRGARQIGKSTWLEQQIYDHIQKTGPNSTLYLNGDDLLDANNLQKTIQDYLPLLSTTACIPKIFIDEITSIPNWEQALKRLFDAGETRHVLIITTGSKAIDLRRGTERLPGRKGRLKRSNFIFTTIGFQQFKQNCETYFKKDLLVAYLLTGGSPVAINELILGGKIPEYVVQLTKDWILGECALQGRSRNLLNWVIRAVISRGGDPIPLDKLAKECGAANNTVIRGYIDLLGDLLTLSTVHSIDPNTGHPVPRKAQKYAWTYLLVPACFASYQPRTVSDFKNMPPEEQAKWLEWAVAAELFRRAAIAGKDSPEFLCFWQSKTHELDYQVSENQWLEVKRGQTRETDFLWFPAIFPKQKLTVISLESRFTGSFVQGITLEDFLATA
jgi:predicted AAA+ superfamily ATPase